MTQRSGHIIVEYLLGSIPEIYMVSTSANRICFTNRQRIICNITNVYTSNQQFIFENMPHHSLIYKTGCQIYRDVNNIQLSKELFAEFLTKSRLPD